MNHDNGFFVGSYLWSFVQLLVVSFVLKDTPGENLATSNSNPWQALMIPMFKWLLQRWSGVGGGLSNLMELLKFAVYSYGENFLAGN